MKKEDLMIDDWVNLNFDVDYKTGKSIYAPVQVTGINKNGTIDVNCAYDKSESMQDGWDLKLIEPILLTSGIMEKNGFENIPYTGIDCNKIWLLHKISYYGKSFPLHTDDIMLRYNISEQCWNIFFNIGSVHSDFRTVTTIFYVHELQHALKLCGIEKEIVL